MTANGANGRNGTPNDDGYCSACRHISGSRSRSSYVEPGLLNVIDNTNPTGPLDPTNYSLSAYTGALALRVLRPLRTSCIP
ncbi:hypothetical protein M378DRAFT_170610 [Amanita muscaria Koide BX008]|uniref:Uncharacterized protein n=1 Tax=Amanita muscaria (strain Koide BX008) TaxID=946122 RepID=A0A0C2S6S9_AMAMK|nr:hypothetical protein M378DRAFT_170610 [Amanita muscaria Koide BX008]